MFLKRARVSNPDYTERTANELAIITNEAIKRQHSDIKSQAYMLLNHRASEGSRFLRLFDYETDNELICELLSNGFHVVSHKINDVLVHDISW